MTHRHTHTHTTTHNDTNGTHYHSITAFVCPFVYACLCVWMDCVTACDNRCMYRKPHSISINRIIVASCCGPAMITGFCIHSEIAIWKWTNSFFLIFLENRNKKMLEVCVDSFESAKVAAEGGSYQVYIANEIFLHELYFSKQRYLFLRCKSNWTLLGAKRRGPYTIRWTIENCEITCNYFWCIVLDFSIFIASQFNFSNFFFIR